MKATDIRGLSDLEVTELENGLVREYLNLKMQKAIGQLATSHRMADVRKSIARIKTLTSEKGRKK